MSRVVPYGDLSSCTLIVDGIYESALDCQLSGERINKLLPGSGNMGEGRIAGRGQDRNWVVLYTKEHDLDCPDTLDPSTGLFTYYGDNKRPGRELHDTQMGGNALLRHAFDRVHADQHPRVGVPPFFVFRKHPTEHGARSVQFRGLAVPGFPGLSATEDLLGIWKSAEGQRFQNYRAHFTILDVPVVEGLWLDDLAAGGSMTEHAPHAWREWLTKGHYLPLTAEPTTTIRSVAQQTVDSKLEADILAAVWGHFNATPHAFEAFAARIYQMTDTRVVVDEITRGVVDGGRDAVGRYSLGLMSDPVHAEFSLEAKCYRLSVVGEGSPVTVGVKDVARLISRIRHRQFGVLVTTSVVSKQAYEEVREDRHPIIFISGRDIAEILIKKGYNSRSRVESLLNNEFGNSGGKDG
ncbi:restriction endonuclease [Billgrantia montanilacus]|uniref:Restriction endonuclease n=1 Tax=Billgrantia montanilacus TaxID=2282305 RepID=A0A368TRG5_9GAMM|nr:restriction endonuclease [Halomonas montanilacus]RCV86926.1 restriction endonuclease [Halomonas montanilacus]